jgi:CDGSH-type Zn-finger protein
VGVNDFATLNPELASEWHPTMNGSLKPNQFSAGSDKRIWWLGKCGHEWDVGIGDRVKYSTGCPFCKGNHRIMNGTNDFETLQPDLAKEWHPTKNGNLKPSEVRENSVKKVWWLAKCGRSEEHTSELQSHRSPS